MKKVINIFMLILFITGTILLTWSITPAKASEVFPFNGIINADSLVVYKGVDTKSGVLTELAYGTSVTVLEDASTKFYKISFDNGTVGYTWKSYIINVDNSRMTTDATGSGVETYEAYCNKLVTDGFDKSYCPYLYYLHSKYPLWTFVADKTGVTLESAAQSEEGKVVLQTGNTNYWYSTKPIEGDYYYVNDTVIASFMDPRNSLYEKTIFQFLDLELSKNIVNDAALMSIAGKTGNLRNYLTEFKDAATYNEINPLHIMSRSRQEGANKSEYDETTKTYVAAYSAVMGKYTTTYGRTSTQGYSLDGYYNFFNIGSYADSNYAYTVQRGLAYAAGYIGTDSCITIGENRLAYYDETKCEPLTYQRPWNTPAKAISGGSEFIAAGYVKKGQDNLYFQKFNVSSYSQYNKYTHQYMTNLYAPVSESNTLLNAYIDGNLMNSEFVFVIPVYENMPEDNYQAVDKSSNSRLSSVTINDKTFTEFDADVVEYNYNLVTTDDTFKIGAKTEDSLSTVTGTGDYTFVEGLATVTLVVTAEDESTTTYVINIKKVVPEEVITVDDVVSKMGIKINGDIIYGVSPDTVVNTLVNTVTKNKGEAVVTDASGKVKASGAFVTGDKITIKGTSDSKTFRIAVRGDINGDGMVKINDLILVQSHILEKSMLTDIKLYAADVNYDGYIKINDLILVQSHILEKSNL